MKIGGEKRKEKKITPVGSLSSFNLKERRASSSKINHLLLQNFPNPPLSNMYPHRYSIFSFFFQKKEKL